MKQRNKQFTKDLHAKNYKTKFFDLNSVVSILAITLILLFFIYAIINKEVAFSQIETIQNAILSNFQLMFIAVIILTVILAIYLVVTRCGNVRLGGNDAVPKFSNFAWYSMLFSAGMGIGIMFYGVAEPILHLNSTPIFNVSNQTHQALATSFFHWGVQAWAIYGIMALALAFYSFNLNLPLAPRSLLYPLIKDKIYGVIGDIIDGICVVTTLFALSSSLGLGAMQVNSGFNFLFDTAISTNNQIIIIIVVTILATLSLVSGLDNGVKFLSELNVKLMIFLFLSILLLGPTFAIISNTLASLITYLGLFTKESFMLASFDSTWINDWSIFYFSWWISWSIFVAMFIAKISYGRTVREFVLSVILIPSILTILWFGVQGYSGIYANELSSGVLSQLVSKEVSVALYAMIEYLFTNAYIVFILQFVSVVLIISFFVTSSDSGSLVVNDLTSSGSSNTTKVQKVFWASLQGIISIILLVIGGSQALDLIQMVLIISAMPVAIILIYVIFSLPTKLKVEDKEQKAD